MSRPTRADLDAARDKPIPDVVAPGLAVLFCGINPSLWSGATGHHFARPGNRFWQALHESGFTPRRLQAAEQDRLLDWGLGVTNLVNRATARAAELTRDELTAGGDTLRRKVRHLRPAWVALVGVTAYRSAFRDSRAVIGEQPADIDSAHVWVLPNPSGLNAHYTAADLAAAYARLRHAADPALAPR